MTCTLVGMFFIRNDGDRYCIGEVVSEPTPGKYLVRFELDEAPVLPLEMSCACAMSDVDEDGLACWQFFSTRSDLDAWLKWLEEPPPDAKPKVVKMAKRDLQ